MDSDYEEKLVNLENNVQDETFFRRCRCLSVATPTTELPQIYKK